MKKKVLLSMVLFTTVFGNTILTSYAAQTEVVPKSDYKCYKVYMEQDMEDLSQIFKKLGITRIIKGVFCPGAERPEVGMPDNPASEKPNCPSEKPPVPEATNPPSETTPAPEATNCPSEKLPVPEATNPPSETTPASEATNRPNETTPAPETTNRPNVENPGTQVPDMGGPEEGTPVPDTDGSQEEALSYAEQVVRLVNAERAKAGLPALTIDTGITAAANVRAKEIKQSFSHTRPNGSSFSSALKEQGVSFRGSGENIAWGQKSPEQVMNGWMNSSGHRANILNKNFTKIGVGLYQDEKGVNYWVQLFTF